MVRVELRKAGGEEFSFGTGDRFDPGESYVCCEGVLRRLGAEVVCSGLEFGLQFLELSIDIMHANPYNARRAFRGKDADSFGVKKQRFGCAANGGDLLFE